MTTNDYQLEDMYFRKKTYS